MQSRPEGSLFSFSEGTYPAGKQVFNVNLMEQYKIACAAADNVSARREGANRYLVTLNTAIAALYGFQATGPANPYLIIPLAIAGLIAATLSFGIVRSHRNLNQQKFKIILELENHLPARIYGEEWDLLKKPNRLSTYLEVTNLERIIYGLFAAIHVVTPTIIIAKQILS